jgi:hypothetical protein
MAPQGGKYGANTYQNNPNAYQPPPPQYGAPSYGPVPVNNQYPMNNQYTGTTFNPNDGYYSQPPQQPPPPQQEGIQLQQPGQSYQRGGETVYQAPDGPPPAKHN